MLLKLILKISLKAILPFAAILGISAYSIYLKGGDPAGMARNLAGNVGWDLSAKASGTLDSVTQSAGSALNSLTGASSGRGEKEQVYRWTDAAGVTHFSTNPPAGVLDTETILVDPDRNLIAGTRTPEDDTDKAPGVAGVALPGRSPEEILGQIE